ncbi:carboxymuconolactone decarboxylase family protein [Enterococcus gilvus]|uniref:Carboxymuconolactone decarboxylase-like domain-containing protein n=1 Tax=Enterococcus gilvus ATCC BAA-350 TaxID=1158614 RepID=R2VCU0_9ENTE|nr:carboxymuconolactone decarboxylase family protein [Enterococcus gilvus]EOI55451.1 hypothetical protein UKC_02659 [Enterococcus gilvus ATCC BAA-350]EOW82006.1 hypothetical protein I592_01307 [Enterococcus gilvus ATCC BAA-350]OJG43035.1 hypothetical protein RV02_GL002955 [Enterococcus gilvus]
MDQEKYDLGFDTLNKLNPGTSEKVKNGLSEIAPDVADYIINFAFGDIYNRPHLDLKQRQVVTLTALLTQGDTDHQLFTHIKGARNFGWEEDEIIEMFIQTLPYVGFPRVLNAIETAKRAFKNS